MAYTERKKKSRGWCFNGIISLAPIHINQRKKQLSFDRIQTYLFVLRLITTNMSGIDHPNMEYYAYEQAPDFNHFLCMNVTSLIEFSNIVILVKQNWTSGILREEAAILDELSKHEYKFFLNKSYEL
jgi:hypothetical protein